MAVQRIYYHQDFNFICKSRTMKEALKVLSLVLFRSVDASDVDPGGCIIYHPRNKDLEPPSQLIGFSIGGLTRRLVSCYSVLVPTGSHALLACFTRINESAWFLPLYKRYLTLHYSLAKCASGLCTVQHITLPKLRGNWKPHGNESRAFLHLCVHSIHALV